MSPRLSALAAVFAALLVACSSCGGGSSTTPPPDPPGEPAACEPPMAKVQALLQGASDERLAATAEADRERTAAAEATMLADDLGLIRRECAATPGRVAPCLASATSARHVLEVCLAPLSDDGSEGKALLSGEPAP